MYIQRLQDFIDHPATKIIDGAALATAAAAAVPGMRETLHDLGSIATDIAPIGAVIWLAVQIICKIIITHATVTNGAPDKSDDDE